MHPTEDLPGSRLGNLDLLDLELVWAEESKCIHVSGTDRAKTEGEAETVVMIVLSTGSTARSQFLGTTLASESPGV